MRIPNREAIPFHDSPTHDIQEKIAQIDRLYVRVGAVNTPMLPRTDVHQIQALLREINRCMTVELLERFKEEKRKEGKR